MNVGGAGWGDHLGKATQTVPERFDRDPDCSYDGIIEHPELEGIYKGMGVAPFPYMGGAPGPMGESCPTLFPCTPELQPCHGEHLLMLITCWF